MPWPAASGRGAGAVPEPPSPDPFGPAAPIGVAGDRPAPCGGRFGMPGIRTVQRHGSEGVPRSRREGQIPARRSERATVTSATGTPRPGSSRYPPARQGRHDASPHDARLPPQANHSARAHALWQAGFIERTALLPLTRGAPLVSRLSVMDAHASATDPSSARKLAFSCVTTFTSSTRCAPWLVPTPPIPPLPACHLGARPP